VRFTHGKAKENIIRKSEQESQSLLGGVVEKNSE
jgi:hypothetical protein